MSKTIMLNSRFWEDNYVSNLDPTEKLLFIYFISNPRISLSGIYEVPLKNIALDTGIDKEMVEKILDRFCEDKKVAYLDNWICVLNYPKYQNYKSDTIQVAVSNEIKMIPLKTLDKFILFGYPIHTLLIGYKEKDKGKEQDKEGEGKGKIFKEIGEVLHIFEEKNPAIKRMYGNTTQRGAAERLITKFGLEKVKGYAKFAIKVLGMPYSPRVTTPYLLETKWADLEAFYHESLGKKEEKSFKVML